MARHGLSNTTQPFDFALGFAPSGAMVNGLGFASPWH